jgi:hypothetical protein
MFGYASHEISARCPTWILPMSLSSTEAYMNMLERSDMTMTVVPPATLLMPEEIICPIWTLRVATTPFTGEYTFVSRRRWRALSSAILVGFETGLRQGDILFAVVQLDSFGFQVLDARFWRFRVCHA